jgi:hypothetical protein
MFNEYLNPVDVDVDAVGVGFVYGTIDVGKSPTASGISGPSTGLASMPTYMSGGMFVGVAGAALVAAF